MVCRLHWRVPAVVAATLWALLGTAACAGRGQRYTDFITLTPLAAEPPPTLVIGFLGGREPWDSKTRNVRKLALSLRGRGIPAVYVETVENARRYLAVQLVRRALDGNRNGQLEEAERSHARVIVYGQSFGGAAVVKFAHELEELGIPILLTVQVDSVGIGDAVIPANVACAANLYQRNGWPIRGEPEIRAHAPARTRILGNFRYDYRKKDIDLSQVPRWKRIFRAAHTKMDFDPEVWARVEGIVLHTIRSGGCADPPAPSAGPQP